MIGNSYLANLESAAAQAQRDNVPLRIWPQDLEHPEALRSAAPVLVNPVGWRRSEKTLTQSTKADVDRLGIGIGTDGLYVRAG